MKEHCHHTWWKDSRDARYSCGKGREGAVPSRWHYVPVDPRRSWRALPGKGTSNPPAQESGTRGQEGQVAAPGMCGRVGAAHSWRAQTCFYHGGSTGIVLSIRWKKKINGGLTPNGERHLNWKGWGQYLKTYNKKLKTNRKKILSLWINKTPLDS